MPAAGCGDDAGGHDGGVGGTQRRSDVTDRKDRQSNHQRLAAVHGAGGPAEDGGGDGEGQREGGDQLTRCGDADVEIFGDGGKKAA